MDVVNLQLPSGSRFILMFHYYHNLWEKVPYFMKFKWERGEV